MAKATRNTIVMKDLKERVCTLLESRLMELVGSMQKTLGDFLKDQFQELVKQQSNNNKANSRGEHNHSSSYS